MAFLGGDEVGAIVIDCGSSFTKVGYAGDDQPKSSFPSAVGIADETEQKMGEKLSTGDDMDIDNAPTQSAKRKFFVGTEQLSFRRDNLEINLPLEDGLVKDWDLVESLWSFGMTNRLRINPKEHPILMVEPSYNTRQNREKMTELIFEKYEAPALFVAKDAVLSCFASGRASGLVLDSGGGKTTAVPVYDGYALQQSIVRSHIAGNRLDLELKTQLERKYADTPILPAYRTTKKEIGGGKFVVSLLDFPGTHPSYHDFRLQELIGDIRHSVCSVSPSVFDAEQNQLIPATPYELPDGKTINVGVERLLVPECLFSPQHLTVMECDKDRPLKGVQDMIVESVNQCDIDIRRDLCSGVIVTGGNTLYPGFVERLTEELNNQITQKVKIVSANYSTERKCGAWIGGSILGSLGTFQQMWMSKAEYEERGKSLVER
eukprot:CAMPEP_0117027354 /NCGR_PEP_ID=MMETSP0472-20121206/20002_1 /TAXON_ID=693140 ORGANISM="Tiarina fusus, Strain LIS" /NCGR_SAMPLE_ID=MMETSP0472 /ASSEMBLY_ACC=CAM_ASM_000603 /LENGTH=431 /DNA_ID=CAMNT_0004734575 /DNA_START=49 /DNA_END=1341 /DNA_ORIENTATION=-